MYALLAVHYSVDVPVYFQDTVLCIYQVLEEQDIFQACTLHSANIWFQFR
jgi:hypothetical protein